MKMHYSRLSIILMGILISIVLCSCGSRNNTLGDEIKDYESETEFEAALNNGTNINGSTVVVMAKVIAPDSKFGFNVQAGEHLNFIIDENSDVHEGGYYKFKVNGTQSVLGSWILYSDFLGEVENQVVDRTVEEVIENEDVQPDTSDEAVISESDKTTIEDDTVTEEIVEEDADLTEEDTITEDDKTSDKEVVEEDIIAEEIEKENEDDVIETPVVTQTVDNSITSEPGITYVLNTNTKKFHKPNCSSVSKMKDKNKKEVTWSRDEVVGAGYDPCGNCHP